MALPLELRAGLALLAVAGALYGWHRVAEKYRDEGRQECRTAAAKEYRDHADELDRIANTAQARRESLAADAARARAAADRLRVAVAGSGLVYRPAVAASGTPAGDGGDLLPLVLGRLVDMARIADERGAAGDACVRAYEALRR